MSEKHLRRMNIILAIVFVFGLMFGCSSGGGGSDPDNGNGTEDQGLNNAQTVTGTVLSSNGDPISGAAVFIPDDGSAASLVSRQVVGVDCENPSEADCASTCSEADGSFELDTSGCDGDETDLVLKKGSLQKIVTLSCTVADCILSPEDTTFTASQSEWPMIAVVTGFYDDIQDVLAKIAPDAYGTIDSTTNKLVAGNENKDNLTLIDGNFSLSDDDYDNFDEYLDGTLSLEEFDVVFINCGNAYESQLTSNTTAIDILTNYVNDGGSLYVTDWSYDFINQTFPGFMNFENDVDQTTPGALGAAQLGTSAVNLDAEVDNQDIEDWLENVTVNAADANTPGNPDLNCFNYVTKTGALNSDDTIPVGDFLGSWAQMDSTFDNDTGIFISSGAGNVFDGQDDRPLTVSRTQGSGMLFYSSYHTAHTCPTPGFWPQERVLQYLIFESF